MRKLERFSKGMGIGGWLTNYKRFQILPDEWRSQVTEGDLEHFETFITEWDLQNISAMGMDHVRMGFDQLVMEEAPYQYRDSIFQLIQNFVGWCEKYHLRPVLNMHKALGNYCDVKEEVTLFDSEELQDRFVALWVEFEKRFGKNEDVVFELLNEVVGAAESWNKLAERTVAAIRALNPNRLIIVGSAYGNYPDHLPDLKVYEDENIIYTFHLYDPAEFTHQQGVLKAENLYYNRKMAWPSDDVERYREFHRLVYGREAYQDLDRMDIEYLRKRFEGAIQFVEKYPDKILWCGEFGTIRHCDITYRENWMNDMIKLCKEYDMPYSVWNYLSTPNDGNRFSLVDDDTRKILSPRMLQIINGNVE